MQEIGPLHHHLPPPLKKIGPTIGPFGLIANVMGKRQFGKSVVDAVIRRPISE